MKPFIKGAYGSLLVILATVFIVTNAPTLEGEFFPVATAYDVEAVQEGTHVILSGQMEKTRTCEFRGMKAYLKDPITGLRVIAPIDVQESIKLRPPGDHSWGPWKIFVPWWTFEPQGTFEVITTHRCHPVWLTITKFYVR